MTHRNSATFFFGLCFIAFLAVSIHLHAQFQTTTALTPAWQSLFNGKDLTGWKRVGNEKWVVERGVIYGSGITQEYGYLATQKTYTDFQLSLRFKCGSAGNSGVYLHTQFEDNTPKIIAGRQVEIDPTIGNHTGGIYSSTKGWIVWPAPELETVLRPYDWNHLRILVEGNRYQSYLNGVRMVDFTYPSPNSTEGVIALQLHSGRKGRMRFKEIFIRDLANK